MVASTLPSTPASEQSPLLPGSSAIHSTAPKIDGAGCIAGSAQEASSPSWFSRLTFRWFTPVLERGNEKKKLDQEDLNLIPLPGNCTTEAVTATWDRHWQPQKGPSHSAPTTLGRPPSRFLLLATLARAFGKDFVSAGALKLVHDLCVFVGPQVLHGMIVFLRNEDDRDWWHGLALTLTVTVSQLVMSLCLRHYFFLCYTTGLRVRTAVTVAVYRKVLVLSSQERSKRTVGEITNLVSIDAQRLQELTTYLHALWYSPLQISLALYFLWRQLGASSLGGVLVILLMIPAAKYIAEFMGKQQENLMKKRDDRTKLNSEVLSGMKIIKLQAWEESFQKRILQLRDVELRQLWRYEVGALMSNLLWGLTPLLVTLTTFGLYVYLGNQLEVASALTALALFEILRFPLFMLPQVINSTVEAMVSMKRLQSFLLSEEYVKVLKGENGYDGKSVDGGCLALLETVSAAYGSSEREAFASPSGGNLDLLSCQLQEKEREASLLLAQLHEAERKIRELMERSDEGIYRDNEESTGVQPLQLCLKRVNMECQRGELIAVVGSVGCGKSSLLSALLGEVEIVAGRASVGASRVAYHSQAPFIMNATVRDNILFGHVNDPVIDKVLYDRALDACALKHDLELLPHGDATEIGEKGVTLSGGQKARVALARAVYHRADLTLIDDALSAVDAHVAAHIFEQAIVGELMEPLPSSGRKRSVVLVTNSLQFLKHPKVSRIIVLQEGRVVEQGSFVQLSRQNTLFSRFLSVISESSSKLSNSSTSAESEANTVEGASGEAGKKEHLSTGVAKTMTEETRLTGHVSVSVYWSWAKAAGGIVVPFTVFITFALGEGLQVLSNWFLTYWSGHGGAESQTHFLFVYALINLCAASADTVRILAVIAFSLVASRRLFTGMLTSVLHAPMSFFDTTPIGRLVNRFSKDMYTIDEGLNDTLINYLWTVFNVLSTIVVISGVTPVFAISLVPILLFYLNEQSYFTVTYRELKRLDSANRSPLYALLGESIDGVPVIRSYGAEPSLKKRLISYIDSQQHAYFLTCAAQSWLAVRLELIGTLIISFACLSAVLEKAISGADPTFAGLAGLAISYALMVTQSLNWSVRSASDLEANMVAVERVKEYTNIGCEGDRHTSLDRELPRGWPTLGQVEVRNAKLRYRSELPLVLKGLNLNIPAGSKVGVVGRTGAGKSTLMTALLRLVELDAGQILIDGHDIREIGLSQLRSSIAVIPQDPVLFSGTVRSNLDPFDNYSDETLFSTLERVGLYSSMSDKTIQHALHKTSSSGSEAKASSCRIKTLNDTVGEGGSNFSVGQRQLLVIARALLHGASLVIMDEATASVDAESDAIITDLMRRDFARATVITVAHRLNTIMDSDYILVMADGVASEFDRPSKLLEKSGGLFRELVRAAARH